MPRSGKTTLFNALTGLERPTEVPAGHLEITDAIVDVPDERLDRLTAMFNPKKKTYTQVTYSDVAGLEKGVSEGGLTGPFRNTLGQVDGFVHVVRAFENPLVPHPEDRIDPAEDIEIIDMEFLFADQTVIENRVNRINEEFSKGKTDNRRAKELELELMQRLMAHMEDGAPLRDMDLTEDEHKQLRGYGLLSLKPVLIVVNIGDEDDPADFSLDYPHERAAVSVIRARLEAEIARLDGEDAAMFMEEYGIDELSRTRVIRESYNLLGIQSFFTVGEDECRAWAIPVGGTCLDAAATIHTDLAKGFIRAEVYPYETLIEHGSLAAVRSAGEMKLEGKDAVVKDGDIVHIRFNV